MDYEAKLKYLIEVLERGLAHDEEAAVGYAAALDRLAPRAKLTSIVLMTESVFFVEARLEVRTEVLAALKNNADSRTAEQKLTSLERYMANELAVAASQGQSTSWSANYRARASLAAKGEILRQCLNLH